MLRKFSKDQENRCSNVYMYISFKKPVFRPLGTGLFTFFHSGNNVVYDLFLFGFVLFCSVLFVLFCLLSFFFLLILPVSTVLLDTVGMLMMAKNASNILIYPSQMDFFRLR